ncbi:MAG: glutathione S-transferase family protein [Gammaproteobacteria bacterium]
MKIYGTKNAGNPVRVALFLSEKGIEVPFEPVDLMKGAHRDPAFLGRNPAAQVPVLELDDGSCISESIAICRYFERLHPNPPLMGIDARDEAVVEMWQRRVEFQFYDPARAVLRHSLPFAARLEPVQLKEWAELNRPRVVRGMEIIDAQLASTQFIAGPRYTVADITALFTLNMTRLINIAVPDTCRHLARWHAEISNRPSVVAILGAPKA